MTEQRILTLTAFFDRGEDADRAAARLAALGIREGVRVMHGVADLRQAEAILGALSEQDRDSCSQGLAGGRHLLIARAVPPDLHDIAVEALEAEGAADMDEREPVNAGHRAPPLADEVPTDPDTEAAKGRRVRAWFHTGP